MKVGAVGVILPVMKTRILFTAFALALTASASLPAHVRADAPAAKPIRTMLYSFTYGTTSDETALSSGISANGTHQGTSGINDYRGSSADRGTITVVVNRVQPDLGLAVTISEKARKTRSAPPVHCFAYPHSVAVCPGNPKVNEEEMTLLRFIGQNFIDPVQMDAKQRWKTGMSSKSGSVKNHFSVFKQVGSVYTVSENRVVTVKGAQGYTASTTGKIVYDNARTAPLSIFEETIMRTTQGVGGYTTMNTQVQLKLTSDSMAKKP